MARSQALALNKPDERILWFDDLGTGNEEYRYLSNFYVSNQILPGVYWLGEFSEFDRHGDAHQYHRFPKGKRVPIVFPSGEHAYQALKADDILEFQHIVNAPDPGAAKHLGQRCHLRPRWEEVKYDVMAAVVRSKFSPGSELAGRLLETGDALLMEGTFWHDKVWGVDLQHAQWPGRNWLGTLLMARRAELRAMNSLHPTERWNMEFVQRVVR